MEVSIYANLCQLYFVVETGGCSAAIAPEEIQLLSCLLLENQ
jgi:hypothetical protein